MTPSIERIIGEFEERFGGNVNGWREGIIMPEEVKSFLRASLHSIREETVREVMACVPEELEDPAPFLSWTDPEHGFNDCRTQTLSALDALIAKEKKV